MKPKIPKTNVGWVHDHDEQGFSKKLRPFCTHTHTHIHTHAHTAGLWLHPDYMTVSSGNPAPLKSTKSRNSNFSAPFQIKPKSQFEFIQRDTGESEFLDLVDFRMYHSQWKLLYTVTHTATHYNTLQHTLQHTATHYNTHCNTLQHTTTHTATHATHCVCGMYHLRVILSHINPFLPRKLVQKMESPPPIHKLLVFLFQNTRNLFPKFDQKKRTVTHTASLCITLHSLPPILAERRGICFQRLTYNRRALSRSRFISKLCFEIP